MSVTTNKYNRALMRNDGLIDVYDVLDSFEVKCPATQHAVKKLLAAGQRGTKTVRQDLEEAMASISRAIELASNRVEAIQKVATYTDYTNKES